MSSLSINSFFQNLSNYFHFISKVFIMVIISILCFLFFVFLIYMLDISINTISGHSKSPLFATYVVVSPSMVPTIDINDAIVIKRNDHDNYKIGDIITFLSNDSNYKGYRITHRVVDKEKIGFEKSIYTTKGDNNLTVDPSTTNTDSIYGKVLFTIPNFGKVKKFFARPSNYFVCLLVSAFVFIFYDLIRIFIMMKKKKEIC